LPLLSLLAILTGASLVGGAVALGERRRCAPRLPAAPPALQPPVTLLLPVRDEERDVIPCVAGLLGQIPAAARVRVVDDGSTDLTASRVAAAAAGEPRLELVPAGPLPEGWRGQVNALATGARGVGPPWIATTDADVRLAPEAVARALAAGIGGRLDLVSLAGLQEARGLGENLILPTVYALLDARLGDWRRVADSTGAPVANGQFLLLRRQAWEECGGFAAVRNAAMDDVAVAERLRERGFRTGFFRAPELLRVRMYHGFGEAWRGWRRNLAAILPARSAVLTALLVLAPAGMLAAAVAAGRPAEALLLWAGGAAASGLARQGSGNHPLYALLYPADSLLLAALLLIGVFDRRSGRPIHWKGRQLPIDLQ
jgi:hypothetical protein